jgi:hypothetical protein
MKTDANALAWLRHQLYICDATMSSSADKFWKAVGHWERERPRIVVELSGQTPSMAITFTALVVFVAGEEITFRDVETSEERTVNFAGAEIRLHSFERIDSVDAFAARWEEGLESANCFLTELGDFGKPM